MTVENFERIVWRVWYEHDQDIMVTPIAYVVLSKHTKISSVMKLTWIYSGYYVKTSDSIKNCGYILRKPNFRRKMRILKQSHSTEKCERGDPLGFLRLQFVAKYQKNEEGLFADIKKFSKRSLTKPKNGAENLVEKLEKGDPSALHWFCISC